MIKTLRAIGFLVIFAVVALNIAFLIVAQYNSDVVQDFGIVITSTFGAVAIWFIVSAFILYIK